MNLRDTPGSDPAPHRQPGHAVPLDLRGAPGGSGGRGGSGAVRAALGTPQHGDGERRFLVIDDASRLVDHQLLYERLYSHGPAKVLCLAVGPGEGGRRPTGDPAAPGGSLLHRPLTLRPPAAGVLWLLDPHTGDDPEGLRPLVELLVQPEVFDAVLRGLAEVVHGVAVPSVRVVEHDLSDEARARAWKEAVGALAGQEVTGGGPGDSVPPELALLLDDSLPDAVAGHRWLEPSRPAAARRAACDDALEDARAGHRLARGPAGLFGRGSRHADLPGRLAGLGRALEAYRDTVAGAFTDADGVRLTPEQRARLLERGIALPDLPAASRTRVVPALRGLTEHLLEQPLPLRSAAARLAALSDRSAPSGSAARLARLDELCDPAYLRHLASPPPFRAGGTTAGAALLALVPALAAGLWQGPGWYLGPAAGVVAAGLGALMWRHRPDRSREGRFDGGGTSRVAARLLGGLAGGASGAVAGSLLGLPAWAGALAAVVALVGAVVLAVRDWTRSVDAWWAATDAEYAARVLPRVDRLLAETAVHDWLLADARHHCADGARAVALLLRGLAATADAYGEGGGSGEGGAYREGGGPARPGAVPGPRPAARPEPAPTAADGGDLWEWDTGAPADDDWFAPAPSGHGGTAADPVPYGGRDTYGDPGDGFGDTPYGTYGSPYGDAPGEGYGREGSPYGTRPPYGRNGPAHPYDAPEAPGPYAGPRHPDHRTTGPGGSRDDGAPGHGRSRPGNPTGPGGDPASGDGTGYAYESGTGYAYAPEPGTGYEYAPEPGSGSGHEPEPGPGYDHAPEPGSGSGSGWTLGPAYEAVPDPESALPPPDGHGHWPPQRAHEDPAWLERERGDGGPDLVGTLVADLAAGTRRVLAPCWLRIERDPARAGRTPLDEPMRELLDEVHGRLLRDAATSPPPHDPQPGRRPDATRMTGVAPDRVARLLAPDGDTGGAPAVPLCMPHHRRLLSADPLAARRVRFAPEAFRRGAASEPDGEGAAPGRHARGAAYAEDVVWTPAGRHAGVLGLVPLRGDAVRTVREDTTGPDGPDRPDRPDGPDGPGEAPS
ncbi:MULTISPECIES: hypothetical protein [Streptomyces]|uniref:Uncharacterized protein n=1 Tax=Streptomyces fradiae ATCC 10745 = DSM 40063 TaxID=1319510 RepID=A0A1Y2P009_STRFR|nr:MULTISPECIES: hypothetical protein [Streptomyces]OSY52791.1 hypothetical protein BG846_01524 [Streptomyces fradiae ATCC 10745 = DSM 40063]QEV14650.1 hypothetical protein CP974_24725 [Streptomyces fradiae ATCC 10745 = DSM 40063]